MTYTHNFSFNLFPKYLTKSGERKDKIQEFDEELHKFLGSRLMASSYMLVWMDGYVSIKKVERLNYVICVYNIYVQSYMYIASGLASLNAPFFSLLF